MHGACTHTAGGVTKKLKNSLTLYQNEKRTGIDRKDREVFGQ